MTSRGFGPWLEHQLHLRDMDQSEFTRRAGISDPIVSQWISGRRSPSAESAKRIAEALDSDILEVLAVLGVASLPDNDPPSVRRIIDLVRRVNLTTDREQGLIGLLERWQQLDEDRRRS